jgi:hypothetical protein
VLPLMYVYVCIVRTGRISTAVLSSMSVILLYELNNPRGEGLLEAGEGWSEGGRVARMRSPTHTHTHTHALALSVLCDGGSSLVLLCVCVCVCMYEETI